MLNELNPWWTSEFKINFKPRAVYEEVKKFMRYKQIISLTGLRRVGKTTIMRKLIEDEIAKGTDPKNILYFSFDEFKDFDIRSILKEYKSDYVQEFRAKRCFLFFDEIQKLEDWESQLKSIYDLYNQKTKIVISGSESLFIRKKSKESLAGRLFEFKIEPLNFREFLMFKDKIYDNTESHSGELRSLFEEFIRSYGFPELIGIEDKEFVKRYVKEGIVDKIIYKDMPKIFKTREPELIESIFNLIMREPGQIIQLPKLAGELHVSRQSLSKYLSYLEDAFLLRKLYNFSRSRRKVERSLKKYYPALVYPELLFKDDDLTRSHVFEWLIVNSLDGEFFWRDAYKNEVDLVIPSKTPLPLEIKYGKIEYRGVNAFVKKFKSDKAYIISYDKEEKHMIEGKSFYVIPAWKFLYNLVEFKKKTSMA